MLSTQHVTRVSFLVVAFTLATAWASPPESIARLQELLDRAGEASAAGRNDEALKLMREALELELPRELGALRGELFARVARIEVKRGRAAAALDALDEAVEAGFAEWESIESDPELALLRKQSGVRPLIKKMKEADRQKRIFQILEWENPDLGWAHLHRFNALDAPETKELRDTWRLKEVIAGKKSELEQQLALAAWVHDRWEHAGATEPSRPEARTILAEAAQGKRFRCVEYSITLAETLQAVGFPARVVGLSRDGVSHGVGKGHVITEVWNNELGRWIVIDGQNNGTWRRNEAILNAAEVRALLIAGKRAELRFGLGPSSWRTWKGAFDEPGLRADWIRYFHHLTYGFENTRASGAYKGRTRVALVHPGERYEPVFQGAANGVALQTAEVGKLYPELNRVHFDVTAEGEIGAVSRVLTLKLSHSSPWFARYRLVVDGKVLEQREDVFRWELKPGENRLELRAIDQMGRAGPPSRLTMKFKPAL